MAIFAALTDMMQPPTSGPVPLTGDRLRLEAKTFYYDASKARTTFDLPNTPLRVTIGRTYEWYESMGEFEGVLDDLDEGGVCKYCGRTRYCQWPGEAIDQRKSGV